MTVISQLPDYYEKHGYHCPEDAFDGPFQFARNTKLHTFGWLKTQPKAQHAFNTVMGIRRTTPGNEWFTTYPIEGRLKLTNDFDILIVDVGGGLGHELVALKAHFPSLLGRMIVQDLGTVIAAVATEKLPTGIEAMAHDFFGPQPIKGAKAYYLRAILHDWPDNQARTILSHIRDAMADDSVLLVNETALQETNVPLFAAMSDVVMMACYAALDRTQAQFKTLLESIGFEVRGVWESRAFEGTTRSLFEAVVRKSKTCDEPAEHRGHRCGLTFF